MTQPDTSAFIGKFVEEARDGLRALGAAMLRLEKADSGEASGAAIGEAMRHAHTLKGSASMMGLADISQISHQLEDLFVLARRNPSILDGSAFDLVFGVLDRLSARVEQLARGVLEPIGFCEPSQKLVEMVATARGAGDGATATRTPLPVAAASHMGRQPQAMSATGTPDGLPGEKDAAVLSPPGGNRQAPEMPQSMRVPVEKLDRLTHLAPEMVLQSLNAFERQTELRALSTVLGRLRNRVREARLTPESSEADRDARLEEYADALDSMARGMREFLVRFDDDRVRLNLITEEFRQNVIELTMQPVASVFDPFPRAVRDLARTFGKDVELTIRGRETEVDKKIIEQIAEPLVHLIRNAVDHGIEAPDERVRNGKPATGRLLLSAEQQGKRIHVTVRDDGRGINPAAVQAAAVRQGIATATELAQWTTQELFGLIFRPGFSTRAQATDVSGRGVGMDVVKIVVERLGGAVHVESELGRGTTIALDLPLSLALLRVVLVEAADELFALPTAAVRRILQVGPSEVAQLQQGPVADIEGESIPLVTLAVLFHLPRPQAPVRQTVLVVEAGDCRFGLLVEGVHEEQELVFKELRGPLGNQRIFTGAALLGNGDIVPILDVSALFRLSAPASSIETVPLAPRPAAERPARVLVVEDSLVAGELQKSILVAAGYTAEIAHDGADALEVLRQKEWDLVISDVDMPRIGGFELTERMRADDDFREIPVIIVTSRDSVDDRRRGFEVGADAYVVKREFDQSQLLDTVQRLIGRASKSPPSPPHAPRRAGRSHA